MRIEHQHSIDNFYKNPHLTGRAVEAINAVHSSGKTGEKDRLDELTPEEQREVQKLKKIDRRVRQHEMAHLAAGAGIARSGTQFTYQTGPDGQQYAVAGEVEIDTSPVSNNPEATIRKAQQIKSAALAPADPSPQDRKVAAQATQMEIKARQQRSRTKKNADSGYTAGGTKTNIFGDVFAIQLKI